MKSTHELKAGNYYLFESLSSANSVYFESELEVNLFKNLMRRYLGKYLEIHRIFIDRNGYQVLVRVRQKRTLKSNYLKRCHVRKKGVNFEFLKSPWKIVSEMMRLFKSVYVKAINRIRGREGVLVKQNFKKYYFVSIEEYNGYIEKMENGNRIRSQRKRIYEGNGKGMKAIDWLKFRAKGWSERFVFKGFQDFVGRKLIKITFTSHSPSPYPPT